MKISNFFYLSLFFAMHIYADSNILFFNIYSNGMSALTDTILITSDNLIKYNIDLSNFKRDSIKGIGFEARRDTALLYFDSIMAFNDKDTLLVDGFEEYDTITDVMDPIITNDKEWKVIVPLESVIKMSIIYRKNGKCFKVRYRTGMGVYCQLIFNHFQDYSNYHTLQLSISRIHPDSTATALKNGVILNKKPDFIKLTTPNTILYTVPPGIHKTIIELYSLSGRKIKTLLNGYTKEGEYSVSLKGYSPGLYYMRASFSENKLIQKLAIVR